MSNNRRKSIPKKMRFTVFARDGFTCRYCGRKPPEVILHIDHIIPISKGGTNDQANLITSCQPCNIGKGVSTIDQSSISVQETLRLNQEYLEQIDLASLATQAVKSSLEMRDELLRYWCDVTGMESMHRNWLSSLVKYCNEFDPCLVLDWIDIAHARLAEQSNRTAPLDRRIILYIHGIARNTRAENENETNQENYKYAE